MPAQEDAPLIHQLALLQAYDDAVRCERHRGAAGAGVNANGENTADGRRAVEA